MDYWDRHIESYQTQQNVTFAKMIVLVNATDCIFYILNVNENAKKVVFVVKWYAICKAK